jgi:hypothetical protein
VASEEEPFGESEVQREEDPFGAEEDEEDEEDEPMQGKQEGLWCRGESGVPREAPATEEAKPIITPNGVE